MTNGTMLINANRTPITAWVRHRATSDALKTTPERREALAEVRYCRP